MVKSNVLENCLEKKIRLFFQTIILFLFLYPVKVPGSPIGTALLALGLMFVYIVRSSFGVSIVRENTESTRMVRSYLIWHIFLLFYTFVLLQFNGIGNGISPASNYLQMLIILPIFYIYGNLVFKKLEELMFVLYAGVLVQSVIIIAALFLPFLTIILFSLFPESAFNADYFGGFEQMISHGYKIGFGVFTSAGSLRLAIGQIGACYFLLNSKDSKLAIHLVLYLFIAIATTLVSRTGLLISVVGLLVVFIGRNRLDGSQWLKLTLIFLLLISTLYFIILNIQLGGFIEDTFIRLFDTLEKGIHDTYFRGYLGEGGDNVIPPLTFETIIGLGITYGRTASGITTITDGGLMRNYSSMGLIVACIYYYFIFSFFYKRYKLTKFNASKHIIIFAIYIMAIGEFKESFIYYFAPVSIMLLALNLIEKGDLNKYQVIQINHSYYN